MTVAAISLVVIFLYGSTVWGIFPGRLGVSWEAHAFGLIGGFTSALMLRTKGPQPKKLLYEIEEELGIEPEVEYWREQPQTPPVEQPRIIVNYQIVPKQVEIKKEDSPPDEKE